MAPLPPFGITEDPQSCSFDLLKKMIMMVIKEYRKVISPGSYYNHIASFLV